MKLLLWLLLVPLTVIFIAFAVANRHAVTLSLDPTPLSLEVPLYGLVYAGIFVGLVAGGIIAWWRAGRWRRRYRDEQRKVHALEAELRDKGRTAAETAPDGRGTDVVKAA